LNAKGCLALGAYRKKKISAFLATMKMAILRSFLLGSAVAAIAVQRAGAFDAVRIDGGEEFGWEENRWYVQVDGVMGGKSSGKIEFMSDNNAMKFTGDISLDGGGFSSVRRQIDLDLSEYAGVVVTLEADARNAESGVSPPMGLHLQFDDRTSRYDFSSAFSVPLSSSSSSSSSYNGDGPVVTSVYLPVESFDRATSFGFECGSNCQFDASEIRGMSVYVLFQEGSFDVRLRSIEAVMEPRTFAPPVYDILESKDDVVVLIQSTISSGGGLYDKSYVELCIAMYWSVLNTVLSSASGVVSDPVQAVICAGLQQVEDQMEDGDSKANIAWTLRHAMDAVIADLQGSSRTTTQDWLPTVSEAASMEVECVGRTSAAQGLMYDPTNEMILVSDSEDDEEEFASDSENDEEEEPLSESENDEEEEELIINIENDEGEPLNGNEVEEEEEPLSDSENGEEVGENLTENEIELSELSSGCPTLLDHGFESVVFGILLLVEVVQLVY
jgi:hypothetical protein